MSKCRVVILAGNRSPTEDDFGGTPWASCSFQHRQATPTRAGVVAAMRSQFLFSQVKTLHDSGLYDSADILVRDTLPARQSSRATGVSQFQLTMCQAQNIICHGSPPPADLLSLYGSVLYKKKEFSRAAVSSHTTLPLVPLPSISSLTYLRSRTMRRLWHNL